MDSFPARFVERYAGLAEDSDAFFDSLRKPLPKSFRVNTIKADPESVKARLESYGMRIGSVPWSRDAFISDSLELGSTLEHFLGFIYIQELTSMLPPLIMEGELKTSSSVLDACAAPGSKTTQISAMMGNQGMLVANDIDYGRIRALKFNLEKSGSLNVFLTNMDIKRFPALTFDTVFVDAPCSSEGTIRKSVSALSQWNEKRLRGFSANQKGIASKCFDMLRPGGAMLYSTCTFAPEENEEVVDFLVREKGAHVEDIGLEGFRMMPGLTSWQGMDFDPEVVRCGRVLPHMNDTGGFFVAKVRKC
jgi:NOL1/NOP2/sun family putative RNA methylase